MDRVKKEIGYFCEEMNQCTKMGEKVTVAILDTGIAWHPDLTDRVIQFQDFVNGKTGIYDDSGHGTHVAGILAGNGRLSNGILAGIAPKADMVVIKILDEKGEGKLEQILKGIDWVKKHHKKYGISVVNLSAGIRTGMNSEKEGCLLYAIEELWDMGLIVVVSAGNLGPQKGSITIPGISRKVITVGALKASREDSCSGRGPTRECIIKPDILAPGCQIISCSVMTEKVKKPYTVKSGTSMATPVISGAIAVLLAEDSGISNIEMKMKLLRSCDYAGNRAFHMERFLKEKYF